MAELRYSILDPTGNITALVEGDAPVPAQPALAAAVMRRHPEVEQVGFLRADGALPSLRMAGGEFCGNASISAAALLLLRAGRDEAACRLQVSGAERPVELRLRRAGPDCARAAILMPPALGLETAELCFGGVRGTLPLVRMQGIAHLIAGPDSPYFALLTEREQAVRAVRAFCETLGAACLGLMFLEGEGSARRLTPLVCVPGSGTVFWENSCASGSAAVGLYLAAAGEPAELTLQEPGGTLRVACDPRRGETWLHGEARLVSTHRLAGEPALF